MIYFLLNNNDLVYIGKTTNISRRLKEHKAKQFNEIATMCHDNEPLKEYELIKHHGPALNTHRLSIIKEMSLMHD